MKRMMNKQPQQQRSFPWMVVLLGIGICAVWWLRKEYGDVEAAAVGGFIAGMMVTYALLREGGTMNDASQRTMLGWMNISKTGVNEVLKQNAKTQGEATRSVIKRENNHQVMQDRWQFQQYVNQQKAAQNQRQYDFGDNGSSIEVPFIPIQDVN